MHQFLNNKVKNFASIKFHLQNSTTIMILKGKNYLKGETRYRFELKKKVVYGHKRPCETLMATSKIKALGCMYS